MGYMRHHAIVVSSFDGKYLRIAKREAEKLFRYVSPISPAATNGYRSFFVPTDGSKEGWDESAQGDANRKQFIDWMEEQYAKDIYLDWVEVQYADDAGKTRVLRHSDDKQAVRKQDGLLADAKA